MPAPAEWTFMVYMAGDNDLSPAGERDLEEMRRVGSSPAVNVVVQFDRAGEGGTRRIHVQKGGAGERVEDLGETDSGSPEALAEFLAWATREFPARRHALVLWNHGGGWQPTEMDRIAAAVAAPGYANGEGAERSASSLRHAFFRTTLETVFGLPTPEERAICSDDGTGHSLDMVELGRVLEGATAALGRPLDLVGMDACLMSNLEVAFQVRPYAGVLVASEEIEPNQGWPYEALLAALVERPTLTAAELAATVVDAYLRFYDAVGHDGPVSQAALDLGRLDDVTAPLDSLAADLVAAMPAAGRAVWDAQRRSARFHGNTLWDIGHFCQELSAELPGSAAATSADAVRGALAPGPGRFVLASGTRGDRLAQCGGVSIYLLPKVLELSPYYAEVGFARRHRWIDMLRSYHAS